MSLKIARLKVCSEHWLFLCDLQWNCSEWSLLNDSHLPITAAFLISGSAVLLCINLGSVVQSIISLTSSLMVKMLTVLVCTISNSQVFLLKKCE